MPTTQTNPKDVFHQRASDILTHLEETGQLKHLQMIESPMDATITLRGEDGTSREVVCLCRVLGHYERVRVDRRRVLQNREAQVGEGLLELVAQPAV
jgi:transcriptional regulator with PAS, ATPase and Fis domain